jgi:hypothetical protein
VALSLGLPPPDVIRHRFSVEPGLSSNLLRDPQSPGHLTASYTVGGANIARVTTHKIDHTIAATRHTDARKFLASLS